VNVCFFAPASVSQVVFFDIPFAMPTMPSRRNTRVCCGAAALVYGAARIAPGFLGGRVGAPATEAPMPLLVGERLANPQALTHKVHSAAAASTTQQASPRPLMTAGSLALLGLGARAVQRRRACQQATVQRRATGIGGGNLEDNVPFELRGFSLAQVTLLAGVALIVFSFGDYFIFGQSGGTGVGGLLLIYAVPILLLGSALQYAELKPVEVEKKKGVEKIFDAKATPTMQKIVSDVTRHRYGDDAHLDSSLKALGLVTMGRYPKLQKVICQEAEESGELEFIMLFESKDIPFTIWNDSMKTVACDRFFGPGIWSKIYKWDAEKRVAALQLTTGTKPEKALPEGASEPAVNAAESK